MLKFLKDFLFEEDEAPAATESIAVDMPGGEADAVLSESPAGGGALASEMPAEAGKILSVETSPEPSELPALKLDLVEGGITTDTTEAHPDNSPGVQFEVVSGETEETPSEKPVVEAVTPSASAEMPAEPDIETKEDIPVMTMKDSTAPEVPEPEPVTLEKTEDDPKMTSPMEQKDEGAEAKIDKLMAEAEKVVSETTEEIQGLEGDSEKLRQKFEADLAAIDAQIKARQAHLVNIQSTIPTLEEAKRKIGELAEEQKGVTDTLQAVNNTLRQPDPRDRLDWHVNNH